MSLTKAKSETGSRMRTEKDKMLAGELYDLLDPEHVHARERTRDLCRDLNANREKDQDTRRLILKQQFGRGGEPLPFVGNGIGADEDRDQDQ
jgi:hypothetical protein